MKKTGKKYHCLSQYFLRTPIFSVTDFIGVISGQKISVESLQQTWENNVLQEAIFLASPYLYKQLSKLFEEKTTYYTNTQRKRLIYTFIKYFARAATRCTPFGLFAGVSMGSFSKTSKIQLEDTNNHTRKTRLDMEYVVRLTNHLENSTVIKKVLRYFPNSTLYTVGDQYRYMDYTLAEKTRHYTVEGVERSSYITAVLNFSKAGKTIQELVAFLVTDTVDKQEAEEFVHVLLDNHLLTSELEPTVTGEASLQRLLDMAKNSALSGIENRLIDIKNALEELDNTMGNSIAAYQKVYDTLDVIGVPYEEKYLLQTDVYTQYREKTLNVKHAKTLKNVVPLLCKLNPYKENRNLEAFKKAFVARYETKEVFLSQVLDEEFGIGYLQDKQSFDTVPFLSDIKPTPKKGIQSTNEQTRVDEIIYRKLLKTIQENEYILTLSDDDFLEIDIDWQYIPDIMTAFVEVLKNKGTETLLVRGVHANAGSLLGRFSHLDKRIEAQVKTITSMEQSFNPKAILAEIVHLPESRTGNILKRTHIREYEIPYLAKSTLPIEQQIPIEDLKVSVKGNRIVLRSIRLNKEVIPRLTNAHNYASKALATYHFLCDISFQNQQKHLGFSWHRSVVEFPFLPRVVYNDIVLSKARWFLDKEVIEVWVECANTTKNEFRNLIEGWRKKYHVPNYIQFVEGDNKLLINLENDDCLSLFITHIKGKERCVLEEFLYEAQGLVEKKGRYYTNECVITLYNQKK